MRMGAHGLEAKQRFKIRAYEIGRELEAARAEHAEWELRIALLRSDQIDRDLLEERARDARKGAPERSGHHDGPVTVASDGDRDTFDQLEKQANRTIDT